ncbi:hypothetical protein LMB73_10570 [Limosilactobacillus reuteri]|uniref:hypothetical protein n=1 Tax=Lactobacillaceae TaxID=33958 RepID=UPI001E35EC38|nr:hypothetical protein [Limosilactobacillus reuteri]MCC4456899.1 hypothetical protein [Limosilactobacillus reuteri]MCC4465627.1 hypothetical protein [Limosilactobacillus reuteri]
MSKCLKDDCENDIYLECYDCKDEIINSKKFFLRKYHIIVESDALGKPMSVNAPYNLSVSHSANKLFVGITAKNIVLGVDIQNFDKKFLLNEFNEEISGEKPYYIFVMATSVKECLGKFLGIGLLAEKEIYKIKQYSQVSNSVFDFRFEYFPFLVGFSYKKDQFVYSVVCNLDKSTDKIKSIFLEAVNNGFSNNTDTKRFLY